jgi:hypothetical protein
VSKAAVRRLAGNLTALVLGLLGALLALELGVRLFSDEARPLFQKHPIVGHRYIPGFAGRRWVEEARREVLLRFNGLGFRGPDRGEAKPPGVRRVAVLGDSFVASVGVEEQETRVAQLEQRLNRDGSGPWEVLSFGVSGYSTAQSLLVWREFARRFTPDVVLLCFYVGNDPMDNDRRLSDYLRPYFRLDASGALVQEPWSGERASLNAWLSEHSRLYEWEKQVTRQVRDRFRHASSSTAVGTPPHAADLYDREPPPLMTEAWTITAALLATLAREVQASGARFLLVTIPELAQVSDDAWRRLLDAVGPERARRFERERPDATLTRIAAAHDIPILSLTPAFRAVPQPAPLFLQEFHWSAAGNRLAAEAVHTRLVMPASAGDEPFVR